MDKIAKSNASRVPCPHCGSDNIAVVGKKGMEGSSSSPVLVRWRRCLDCEKPSPSYESNTPLATQEEVAALEQKFAQLKNELLPLVTELDELTLTLERLTISRT